jgi:hypothetical protein
MERGIRRRITAHPEAIGWLTWPNTTIRTDRGRRRHRPRNEAKPRLSPKRGQARKRPRKDSNLRTRFRKPMLYPLSYGGGTSTSYPLEHPRLKGGLRLDDSLPQRGQLTDRPETGLSPRRPASVPEDQTASCRRDVTTQSRMRADRGGVGDPTFEHRWAPVQAQFRQRSHTRNLVAGIHGGGSDHRC